MDDEAQPLDLPAFLKPEVIKPVEFIMSASEVTTESVEVTYDTTPVTVMPAPQVEAPAKPARKATVKAARKPKAKAAAKPKAKTKATAKPAKAVKAKAAKTAKPKTAVKLDKFGLRQDSAKSQAALMYAARGGATLEEVKASVGSIQLNVLNDLEEAGHEVTRKKEKRDGQRPVTRYYLKAKKN